MILGGKYTVVSSTTYLFELIYLLMFIVYAFLQKISIIVVTKYHVNVAEKIMTFYGKLFKVICISDVILDSKTNEWNFCRTNKIINKVKIFRSSKLPSLQQYECPKRGIVWKPYWKFKKKNADSIETSLFLLRVLSSDTRRT